MRVCVVIPTYNEAGRIAKVLADLRRTQFDVVIVDDGSTDKVEDMLVDTKVIYLRHVINRGQGAALKTGTQYARDNNYDIVAHFDADGQHRVDDLLTIVDRLARSDRDIVLGSRFLDNRTDFPLKKKVILWLASIFTKQILKLNFTDPQSGLRTFKLSSFDQLDWQKDNFEHCSEILNLIIKSKLNYEELPIIVNYPFDSTNKLSKPRLSMGWRLLLNKILD